MHSRYVQPTIDVVLDLQSGDGGKGRIVKWLCDNHKYDLVCRFAGANNAGHTVYLEDGRKVVLHLIPIGILSDNCKVIIGHNCMVNLDFLLHEVKILYDLGIKDLRKRIFVSGSCHVILPKHLDKEINSGEAERIGSTKRGVAPCASDKYNRTGVRISDIVYDKNQYAFNEVIEELSNYVTFCDTIELLHKNINKEILCEGAQGYALDIDMGIYPYVTSSNTTIGGVMTGLGVPASRIRRVVGIIKAYSTKVGTGPFITELGPSESVTLDFIRYEGKEFGATTGRPRKIGWIDLPQIRQAIRINGITDIIMTKMDVLNGLKNIQICDKYTNSETGKTFDYAPSNVYEYNSLKPHYINVQGWESKDDKSMRDFIRLIEGDLDTKITYVSVGTQDKDMIKVKR